MLPGASEERHLGNDPAKQALKTSLETDKGIGRELYLRVKSK